MIGQFYTANGQKYNVIILCGGAGSRMGESSDYIPKALVKLGSRRAIDWIIDQYSPVAHKFIIGTAHHADLLENYVSGRYPKARFEFSRRDEKDDDKGNGWSTLLALDHADSRHPTIITFCDLVIPGGIELKDDMAFLVGPKTTGNPGTFRHTIVNGKPVPNTPPAKTGLVGAFVCSDTVWLKAVSYTAATCNDIGDLTESVMQAYWQPNIPTVIELPSIYEFGTENDLQKVRELWEKS